MKKYPEKFDDILAQYPGIVLQTHMKYSNTLELTYFEIPPENRGQGLGTHLFQAWLNTLPEDIHFIELFAADTGRTQAFWESLGFSYSYTANDENELIHYIGIEQAYSMCLGIHGHKTPLPELIDPYSV